MIENTSGDGIDQAAAAFQAEIAPESRPRNRVPKDAGNGSDAPEEIFTLSEDEGGEGGQDDFQGVPNKGRSKSDDQPQTDSDGDEEIGDIDPDALEEGEEEAQPQKKAADDDGDEEIPLDATVTVKIDGQEQQVPLKEALDGYIRTETFHRRLNALHNERQQLDREVGETAKSRQRYTELLGALEQQLDSLNLQEPNWAELFKQNPEAAQKQYDQWNTYKGQRQALKAERERVTNEQREEQTRQLQRYIQTERQRMLDQNPQWGDRKVFERDWSSMARTAKDAGFSEEEFQTLYDSRMAKILLKASKFDRIMAKKPKPIKDSSARVVVPKAGARTAQRGMNSAAKRLAQTGSVDAAASVFRGILSRER